MAALLQRATPGQSPEPQADGSPKGSRSERTWNPLLVPRELYIREGLVWQPQQPVSLTVEVNGKRDMMKYAAVMQLTTKLGFIARLGQPGAAAKFQNLHLVDVKRRGSTDIHICLGELAWTRSHAFEASVTAGTLAPPTAPSSAAASPEPSDTGLAAPEACTLTGGASDGGLLSGSSSEGTTAAQACAPSVAAAAPDVDPGAISDSHSAHGVAASDPDDKATVTSAAIRPSANAQASCLVAATAGKPAADGPAAAAVVTTAALAAITGAVAPAPPSTSADAAGSSSVVGDAVPAPAPSPAAATTFAAAELPAHCCSCAFCPCRLDPGQLEVSKSPPGSVVAERQMCFGKLSTPASGGRRMSSNGTLAPADAAAAAALAGRQPLPPTGPSSGDALAGGGGNTSQSHISRERLRNLCLPGFLKTSSSVTVPKATVSGPGDGGRAGLAQLPVNASASLPPLRATTHGSMPVPAAARGIWVGGASGASCANAGAAGGNGGPVGVCLIDRELVLPPALVDKRMDDTHALVQYEIDGEVEDCKMQYRLVRSDNGRTMSLQGISRPLRGLQLLELSEAEGGDLFIRAVTPSVVPSPIPQVAAEAGAAAVPSAVAAAAPAAEATAAAIPAGSPAAVDKAPGTSSRSSSGRQRKPSLKIREGANEPGAAVKLGSAGSVAAAAAVTALASPLHGPSGEVPATLSSPVLQSQQRQATAAQQHSKRRGRPPKPRPPAALRPPSAVPAPLLASLKPEQQLPRPKQQRQSAQPCFGAGLGMSERILDSQDGCDDHAFCMAPSVKRAKTAAAVAAERTSSSSASDGGISAAEPQGAPPAEGPKRGALARAHRSAAAAAPLPPLATAAAVGRAAMEVLPAARAQMTVSNPGSAAELPPLASRPSAAQAPPMREAREGAAEATTGPSRPRQLTQPPPQRQQDQQQPQQPKPPRASSTESPSGRAGRKRRSAMSATAGSAGAAADGATASDPSPAAETGAAAPAAEPCAKRAKISYRDGSKVAPDMVVSGEALKQQQQVGPAEQQQQHRPESPQGSEAAAAGARLSSRRGSNLRANTRGAARHAQAPPQRPPSPSSSSSPSSTSSSSPSSSGDDSSNSEPDDEADETFRPSSRGGSGGANAVARGAARASGDGSTAAGARAAEGGSSGAGPSNQAAPAAAPAVAAAATAAAKEAAGGAPVPRHKPRQRVPATKKGKPNRHPSKISNVIRNAGAIVLMIGPSPLVYEKQLRATFGNNPDTSKALRLLEEQGKVMRGGAGYRMHPYHYTLTPVGRTEYERLLMEKGPSHVWALSMGVKLPDAPPAAAATAAEGGSAAGGEGPTGEGAKAGTSAATAAIATVASEAETEAQSGEAAAAAMAASQRRQDKEKKLGMPAARQLKDEPNGPEAAAPGFCGLQSDTVAESKGPTAMEVNGAAAAAGVGPEPSGMCGSPCASTRTVQALHHQLSVGGGAGRQPEVAAAAGLPPAAGSAAGTPALPPPLPLQVLPPKPSLSQQQQQIVLLQIHHSHPHALGGAADQHQHQPQFAVAAANMAQAATATGALPAVAATASVSQPPSAQPLQAVYACPVNYQLSYSQALQVVQAPDAATMMEQGTAAGSQAPYGSPYAVYGYVPTPYGYMPCAMYSAYPAAGAPAAVSGAGAVAAVMPQHVMAAAAPASAAASAVQQPAPATAAVTIMPSGVAPSTAGVPAFLPAYGAIAPAPLPQPVPQPLPVHLLQPQQQQSQVLAQPHELVSSSSSGVEASKTQAAVHAQMIALAHPAPAAAQVIAPVPQAPPPQEQQQPLSQQAPSYRYVVEQPGGAGWRAEVPSTTGAMYCSPCFPSGMQAAAAADLLMSKLRPGEPLNLGINPHEEATLASWTVEQVLSMLWSMAEQQQQQAQ